jgi:D-serine deaminase-like pyridoxal phosphate-dependent protein
VPVWLDVNVGMNRTGSPPGAWEHARDRLPAARHVSIVGLHGYDGHLTWDQREQAHVGYDALCRLARALPRPPRWIVTSGTHSYAHALAHAGLADGPWVHQVSPGTILLSDLRSHEAARDLGLQQGAFVASRVVSTPCPDRVTLDAGSKAVSPDRPAPNCRVLGHPELEPQRPSEEHLPLQVRAGTMAPAPGTVLWLVPEHVCTTVNLYRRALWLRGDAIVGEGAVEAMSHPLWADDPTSR